MKNIKVDYVVRNNVFEDGEQLTIELPISEGNYNFLINKNSVVKQTLVNTVVNIARMQGYQYADIIAIYY